MQADWYQTKAHSFAKYKRGCLYPFFGLSEETGEVMGKLAKFLRKNGRYPEIDIKNSPIDYKELSLDEKFHEDIKAELGDVCWMVAECALTFGLSLSEVMQYNIDKLTERQNKNLIVGEGDTIEERMKNK